MPLKDDALALTKLSRNRRNLEKIQGQLEELRGFADDGAEVLTALADAREKAQEFYDLLENAGDDNPLFEWIPDMRLVVDKFLADLPGDEEDAVDELISEAEGQAEEYENCIEDKDYSADDREEIWGNLLDSMSNIAGALP